MLLARQRISPSVDNLVRCIVDFELASTRRVGRCWMIDLPDKGRHISAPPSLGNHYLILSAKTSSPAVAPNSIWQHDSN